jgi:hypothetical protein
LETGKGCDGDHSGKSGPSLSFIHRQPERRRGEKRESNMGVIEIILVGFIGMNAALGLSSLVTVRR